MLPRTTRLEFTIVGVALVVLLFCSKPPKRGTAGVNDTEIPYLPPEPMPFVEETPAEPIETLDIEQPEEIEETPLPIEPAPEEIDEPTISVRPDNEAIPTQPAKRHATVDARNSQGLNYGKVMRGQVTVRWVWNGRKHVPQKVCVVQEPNGVTSVWSFDQQDGAVLTEVEDSPGY